MSKSMLVNVTHVEESRVATLDNGVLAGYELETINRTHVKGNIYNAVVESVHGNLEAAFVRIGPDLKGFLPIDEVNFTLLPSRGERGKNGKIGTHLHPGQKIMAQVVREPFSGKPATVSTYFSLPGRFLVLMPGSDHAGVSRKIEDAEQRDRLKKIVKELRVPDGFGVIVRTAGIGQTKTELQRDLRYLLRLWQSIQKSSQATEFPGLVYREADLVIRTIRDHMTADIDEVWIDSKETFERALAFVRDVMPTKVKQLKLYSGDRPLFNKFNLEEQIESIYKRRVTLPSGGEIVIDGTEALTAIDVNSARTKRRGDMEDTALQTNIEAAREIARQLRLRDLGGLIVIDFIDLARMGNKKKLEKELKDAMKGDRAKHDVTRISKLGLVEIARQRIKSAKMGATYTGCPTCEGYGLIKNVESAAIAALRKLQTRSARDDIGRIKLGLPPEVAQWMLNNKRQELSQIERRHRIRVDIDSVGSLLRHETRFETFPREAVDTDDTVSSYVPVPDVPMPPLDDAPEPDAPSEQAAGTSKEPGGEVATRRRRRRGGRGRGRSSAGTAEGKESAEGARTPDPAADAADTTVSKTEDPIGKSDETATTDGAPKRRRRGGRGRGGRGRAAAVADEDGDTTDRKPTAETATTAGERDVDRETERVEAGGSTDGDDDRNGDGTGRRRRRRRRRRAGSHDEQADSGGGESAGLAEAGGDPEPAVVVPRNVVANELMPAAVGGSRRGSGGASGGRRRRGSGGGRSRR